MKAKDQFKLHGKDYTAVKMFSSEIINVSGIQYQQWYLTEEKDGKIIEHLDWIPVGKSEVIVNYRRPCVRETERRAR